MGIFSRSSKSLLAALLLVLSTGVTARHASNGPLALPEARIQQPTFAKNIQSRHIPVPRDAVEKATASIRGGAAASSTTQALLGIAFMAMVESGLKKFFAKTGINFPSQLGGCMFLFAVAVVAQAIAPGSGDAIESFLTPGCNLLNKWLPAFFVPGLAMLPLAPSIGSGLEVM